MQRRRLLSNPREDIYILVNVMKPWIGINHAVAKCRNTFNVQGLDLSHANIHFSKR